MSADDLTWAVEASAAQITLMWMVHQWKSPIDGSSKPLDLQIIILALMLSLKCVLPTPFCATRLNNSDGWPI